MRAWVLTISDSSFAGTREDRSGPAVRERMAELGWTTQLEVLPDDRDAIAGRLAELADSGQADAILTTGGTGVAPRDVTPEATLSVLDRQLPGFGELMRMEGRKSTRFSVLSRAVAGTRGRTCIVNLPGSPKGALESLNTIVELLPHVVDLLNGRTEHKQQPKLPSER